MMHFDETENKMENSIEGILGRYKAKFGKDAKEGGHYTDHFVEMLIGLVAYREHESRSLTKYCNELDSIMKQLSDFFDNPKKKE